MLFFALQVEDDSDSDEEVANEGAAAAAAAASTTSTHHRLPGSSEVHTRELVIRTLIDRLCFSSLLGLGLIDRLCFSSLFGHRRF